MPAPARLAIPAHAALLGRKRSPAPRVEAHQRDHLGALTNLAHGCETRAQRVAQSRDGEAVLGLVSVDGHLSILRRDVTQIAARGDGEDLLDDVGNFPEDWT